MQNGNYPEDPYAQFDPQLTAGNGMTTYNAAVGNNNENSMYATTGGYGGQSQIGGQYYPQQGYSQMANMNGAPLQQFVGYGNQPQFAPSYGPSHMASYVNRRSTLTALPVMDIGLPPLAIKVFAERDEEGRPIPPMFLTAPNHDAGVVYIQHNPFNIKINEILVALGQDCVVQDYPQSSGIAAIHIIQDRMTGKTNDIFVEVKDWNEAEKVMRRYNSQASRDRAPKLGNRRAKMSLSTSSNLMKAIFPRAKCTWVNGKPDRPEQWLNDNPCQWDGFITREEMVKILLFAEQPTSSKTRFAQESPERVYQFMITSMQKIPWEADRFYFPKEWVVELHNLLSRMAFRLAELVIDRHHVNLDSKLLEQFMKVMHSSPMYGNGDPKAMENYMSIASRIDDIVAMSPHVAAPPHRRGTMTINKTNNGGPRPERNDSALIEGLRGMQVVNRHAESRDRSLVRRDRGQSPVRRDYRDQSPVRNGYRGHSPVRRAHSPIRHDHRDQSPVTARREYYDPVRNQSPVRRNQSPVRQNESPARRRGESIYSRNESPVRRNESPTRYNESSVRHIGNESQVRQNSPARRGYSPVRLPNYSPVRLENHDRSPARRSDQHVSDYPSRAPRRATTSGSPHNSSSSGRRSTLQYAGSSTGRNGRRYDD